MKAAVGAMSEGERRQFETWFDGLTSAEAFAALRAIVPA